MAIVDKLDIGINFNLSVSPFLFNLSDPTDYGSEGISTSDVKGNFEITGPAGLIYTNSSWVTPDLDESVSNEFNTVEIPSYNNLPYPGIYTFKFTVQISGAVQPGEYDKTFTVTFDYARPKVVVAYNNNPYTTILTSTDVTQYIVNGVLPTLQRVHTLKFPSLFNVDDIVTSSSFIQVGSPYYLNGVYESTVVSTITYDFVDYFVTDTIEGSNSIVVEDIVDIKSIFCCLDKLNKEICLLKNTKDAGKLAEKNYIFNRSNALLTLMDKAVQLGQYDKANQYIEEIYSLTGCTKGCTCGNFQTSIVGSISTIFPPPSPDTTVEGFEIGDFKHTTRSVLSPNWRFTAGQVVLISDYQELYDIYGTTFNTGGEPSGYFRFPDTKGRVLMGEGLGSGLTNRVFGQKYGTESHSQSHSHAVNITGTATIPDLAGIVTIGVKTLDVDPITPGGSVIIDDIQMSAHDISGLSVVVTGSTASSVTGSTILSIIGAGSISPSIVANPFIVSYTPTGTNGAIGTGTFNTNVSAVTVANTTGTTALSISGAGTVSANPFNVSYTPTGTNGAIGTGTFTTNVSAVTVANTTGSTALTITGTGTLAPSVTVGIPGNGTLNTNVSAVTVANNTGTTSLTIGGTGTVTSNTVTGVSATPTACVLVGVGEASQNVARCLPITVADFTVDIAASAIASALSLSPNGHSHTIPALAVTVTQGITGALTAPSATSSIAASAVAAALSITPDPHTHTIPALAVTVTQGVTGSLTPPVWTATNSLNQNITVLISGASIAAALSVTPNPHDHTIPALAVTVTQGVTGSLTPPVWTATNSLNQAVTVTGTVPINGITIAALLSVSPNGHTHTIPSLTVSGTGSITGSIPDHTFVSGAATFIGDLTAITGTVDIGDPEVTITGVDAGLSVVGNTDSTELITPLIQPSLAVYVCIKVK